VQTEDKGMALDASTIVLLAALVFGLFRQGAYHESQHLTFGVLVGVAVVLRLAGTAGRIVLVRAAVVALPLTASSAFSLFAADDRSNAASTFVMIGLCAGALAVGLGVAEDKRRLTVDVVLAALLVVAVTSIHGVATHSTPWGRVTGEVWRGSSSITYANGAAAALLVALTLAVNRAARSDSRLHAVCATLSGVALLATQSRAGVLAALVATAVFLVRDRCTESVRTLAPIVLGVVVGASALVRLAPVAASPRPLVTWTMVAVGCGATAMLWPHRTRITRPGVLFGVMSGAVAVAVAVSPLRDRLTLSSATTASGPGGSVVFGDRGRLWTTAWDLFEERPVRGHGPGNVDLRWTESGAWFEAMFVHNEFLELLVTHGVVGLAALVASALLLTRVAGRSTINGTIAATGVFLFHSAFDFLWHIPVLPVLVALLLGLAFSVSPDGDPRPNRRHAVAASAGAE
jgi:O-antigen ligase